MSQNAFRSAMVFPSDWGWMQLIWCEDRLSHLTLGHPSSAAAWNSGASAQPADPPPKLQTLADRLQAYAGGADDDFLDVELDLTHLTAFQSSVVARCRRIPLGETLSYGELAAKAGSPGAARAVGNVMAKNRFPIIVPCHRVVGSGGALGGFSAPEGITLKQRMLERESCLLAR